LANQYTGVNSVEFKRLLSAIRQREVEATNPILPSTKSSKSRSKKEVVPEVLESQTELQTTSLPHSGLKEEPKC
jgi:hypothetical protein